MDTESGIVFGPRPMGAVPAHHVPHDGWYPPMEPHVAWHPSHGTTHCTPDMVPRVPTKAPHVDPLVPTTITAHRLTTQPDIRLPLALGLEPVHAPPNGVKLPLEPLASMLPRDPLVSPPLPLQPSASQVHVQDSGAPHVPPKAADVRLTNAVLGEDGDDVGIYAFDAPIAKCTNRTFARRTQGICKGVMSGVVAVVNARAVVQHTAQANLQQLMVEAMQGVVPAEEVGVSRPVTHGACHGAHQEVDVTPATKDEAPPHGMPAMAKADTHTLLGKHDQYSPLANAPMYPPDQHAETPMVRAPAGFTLAVHTGQQPTLVVPDFWHDCPDGATLMWQHHDGVKWDMVEPHWNQRLTNIWSSRGEVLTCRSMAELSDHGSFETYDDHPDMPHQWQVVMARSDEEGGHTDHPHLPTGVATPRNKRHTRRRTKDLRMVTVFRTAPSPEGEAPVVFPGDAELVWQWFGKNTSTAWVHKSGVRSTTRTRSRKSWHTFEPSTNTLFNRAWERCLPRISWLHKSGPTATGHTMGTRYTINFADYTQTSGDLQPCVQPIRLVAISPGDHRPQQ